MKPKKVIEQNHSSNFKSIKSRLFRVDTQVERRPPLKLQLSPKKQNYPIPIQMDFLFSEEQYQNSLKSPKQQLKLQSQHQKER